ncbi:MraY family glycosyltransferase [Yoonia sp. MH D7]
MLFTTPFLVALFANLLTAILIVSTQHLHGHLSLDSHAGVQKLHKNPVPRVGGIALLFGAGFGGVWLPEDAQSLWFTMCISVIPAFVFGLTEDITKRVGIKSRLFATICSGLIFSIWTGYQINAVDISGINWMLSFGPLALLFTAVAIGGVANAVNIIDGVNGLALGTAIITLASFATVGAQIGDSDIVGICVVGVGTLAGVFLLNFPKGNIFLGDAGAYSIGFFLAAIAVALPFRNPEVSPLIGLLALAYPVIETGTSILRRTLREGTQPGQPDRLHLHSLVYRSQAKRIATAFGAPHLRNPVAGLLLMAMPLMSGGLMVLFYNNSLGIAASLGAIAVLYAAFYRKVALLPPLVSFKRKTGFTAGAGVHLRGPTIILARPPQSRRKSQEVGPHTTTPWGAHL